MNIHLYTFCYNEEFIIPYFLRHYLPIVSKIIVFDNYSTDKSVDLLQQHQKVFVKKIDTGDKFRDDVKRELTNNAWKRSKGHADYVIVLDIDEFLYHPNFLEELVRLKQTGYTVIRPIGYDMITADLPATTGQIYDQVKEGMRNREWDKMALFDPNKIEEINFSPGAHWCLPEGYVKALKRDHDFKLLHFRYLGFDYVLDKHKKRAARLSDINLKNNWGYHYLFDDERQRKIFDEVYKHRQKIVP